MIKPDPGTGLAAETLPLASIEQVLCEEIPERASRIDVQGLELAEIYINGSYGGGAATTDSDIDIVVGVLRTDDVTSVHPDEWIEYSNYLCEALTPYEGWDIDVMVLPRDESFLNHLRNRCTNGGYGTVFDLYGRAYKRIEDL